MLNTVVCSNRILFGNVILITDKFKPMKSRRFYSHFLTSVRVFGWLCVLSLGVLLTSCKEDISEDNYSIKTQETMSEYLANNPAKYSSLKHIFDIVKLGNSADASSLTSVLSARGNYTLFAPNNEAVDAYVKTLGLNSVDELSYEQAQLIAYSCLIDNGDDAAYEESEFPTPGTFAIPNFNDRLLSCAQDTTGGVSSYIINGNARVAQTNTEVSNGMIHEVTSVIAPSSDNVYELIASADNMKIISHLIEATSYSDTMALAAIDNEYEKESYPEKFQMSGIADTKYMQHRYMGYTALVEPDSVFEQDWSISLVKDAEGNVTNWDQVMEIVKNKCEAVYGTAAQGDLKNPDNAINRFVAYHFMQGRMAYDRFVHHYNEYGYKYGDNKKPQTNNLPVNVWDYYATIGKYRGLIKITQVGDTGFEHDLNHTIYANRISIYNDGTTGDYTETGVKDAGIKISPDNGKNDNSAVNGYYFPVNKILLYDSNVRNELGNERIRIDITTMLPEIASNSVRGNGYFRFPNGYFDNITNESSGTILLYLMDAYSSSGGAWRDYQGDEVMVAGLYDFVLKLPPVPVDGTYEIRMGASHNTLRGMAQIYFGSDPLRLVPAGLPYDMRQTVGTSAIPWVADGDDESVNAENDKNMRNQGYMKAPNYFCITNGKGDPADVVRNVGGSSAALRRIITVSDMSADKTYYLRFKSALKKLDSQLFLDYFEIVPTSVYNGVKAEDIW